MPEKTLKELKAEYNRIRVIDKKTGQGVPGFKTWLARQRTLGLA